jgi:ribosomal protein S18 acetylase RimI-like enzyme
MMLVDLSGRQDEPAIRRVLEQSHGSTEALEEACGHYRSGEWAFIGLQERGAILACAGAEKLRDGTIGIRSIAVAAASRNRGLGRTLIDALAERACAKRVVAETDDDAVGFYRRCGFAVENAPPKFGRARYWCTREISNRTATHAPA